MKNHDKILRLVESALMLAVAAVLSELKVLDMPYGGSVTAFSAVPIVLIAYRYGVKWGLFTGFVYSLTQLFFGFENFSYVTGAMSIIALLLCDYLIAFTGFGLGGMFRKKMNQTHAMVLGMLVVCVIRYVCHTISGFTVWRDASAPFMDALVYSVTYNAAYMIPETLVNMLGIWYLSKVMDFRQMVPTRAPSAAPMNVPAFIVSLVSKLALFIGGVVDAVLIFGKLQAESGQFDIHGFANVEWVTVAIVTGVALVLFAVLEVVRRQLNKKAA